MNNGDVNHGRRRFLVGATSVIGGVGAVGLAVPFVSSWQPSAKAEAAGAPRRLNITKIEEGERVTVEWRGQPVWVVRRTQMLDQLDGIADRLEDPNSEGSAARIRVWNLSVSEAGVPGGRRNLYPFGVLAILSSGTRLGRLG